MLLQKKGIDYIRTQVQRDTDTGVYWKASEQISIKRRGGLIYFWHLGRLSTHAPFSRERNSKDHPRISIDMACRIFRVIAKELDCTIERARETDTRIEFRFVQN